MDNLTQLILDYINLNERINSMYSERRNLEQKIKAEYEVLREKCGRTGKTIDKI